MVGDCCRTEKRKVGGSRPPLTTLLHRRFVAFGRHCWLSDCSNGPQVGSGTPGIGDFSPCQGAVAGGRRGGAAVQRCRSAAGGLFLLGLPPQRLRQAGEAFGCRCPLGSVVRSDVSCLGLLDSAAAFTGRPGISGLSVSGRVWRQRANFAMAAGVTGVKKLTRLPSGSRNSSDRLPQGIVVGSVTKSVTKPVRFW